MTKNHIKHIWFDFSETIVFLKKERHDRLRYETYAKIIGRPVTSNLIAEYEDLYIKFKHSNAAIFYFLGQPADFWSEQINSIDPREIFELADKNIPKILKKLKNLIPISLFSNVNLGKILNSFQINPEWFTHIINASMLKEPKPALEGFYKMAELSKLPAENILYIGDDINKDVKPAKQVGIKTGLMWKKSNGADYSFMDFKEILNILFLGK